MFLTTFPFLRKIAPGTNVSKHENLLQELLLLVRQLKSFEERIYKHILTSCELSERVRSCRERKIY